MPPKKKASAKKRAPAKKVPAAVKKSKKAKLKSAPQKRATVKRKKATSVISAMKLDGLGFPVVGIGASAGGLEAITDLVKHLPNKIGMAFVLVQHLAPEHQSMMTELLMRETQLKVSEIKDGVKVEPDNVYVIPPNTNLGMLNGALHLMPRETKKQHLPIDYFFQSLAKDQGSNAIGIILSGSASDGTLGLKTIKTENGITFAQTPETARYESMPVSAIAAGCVDFVLNPEEMARELIHLAQHPDVLRADIAAGRDRHVRTSSELDKIFILLRNRTGNDFTYYKHNTIRRRVGRRMLVHKIERLKDYVRYLNSHPAEVDALFNDILINVTSFFRDPEVFDVLKKTVYPEILQARGNDQPVRIWIPGCSTGEEVYSIIISLMEFLGDNVTGTLIQVFATDIDEKAIEKARLGIYPEGIVATVSQERLRRYFTKVPQGYQISKNIRDMCVFAPQNIIKDPPFSRQDLVACRNMLIYMGNTLQRKVLQTLHYALNSRGYLLLGSSETIGGSADLFSMADKENKIYKKKDVASRARYEPIIPANTVSTAKTDITQLQMDEIKPIDLNRMAENIILNQYSPPGVVVNERLDIVRFIGHTGLYLDPAPGAASLNLIKLAHTDLSVELRVAAHEAIRNKAPAHKKGARLRHNGKIEKINIDIVPMPEQLGMETYYLVLFQKAAELDAGNPKAQRSKTNKQAVPTESLDQITKLQQELEANKAYMQSIVEEQESANEELQSANEEIQSTNEELQSTNEELETAKEELQSTNEELITVNDELESRNTELSTANNDLRNIIFSADLPIIMLNETLSIRYFSAQAHRLLNLIESDIGRPISNIRANVDTGDITEAARKVIDTLNPSITEVHDDQGHTYSMRIRPYRTEDNHITGVVIIFFDITEFKLIERIRRLATVVEDSNDAITAYDFNGRILAWNPRASDIYGFTEAEALNSNIDILIPKRHYQESLDLLQKIKEGVVVPPYETERQTKNHGEIKVSVTMSVLRDSHGNATAVSTTERPIVAL